MNNNSKEYVKTALMELGAIKANETMSKNYGGPFGAVVVKDNTVIAISSNTVLKDHDPTAHAEVNAIREACRVLGTHDLSGCELYATSEPCPMCLSAIMWANIKKVYYGCTAVDAANIGFRDDFIYNFIEGGRKDASVLELEPLGRESCIKLFEDYIEKQGTIY